MRNRASVNIFRTDLSSHMTSYDLLKTFAIILMVIDHLGFFFFPHIEELRLIGRLSAPIWFFLIGYARTRKLELRLWIWGAVLLFGGMWIRQGHGLLPLNILFDFLLIRAILEVVMVRAVRNFETLFGMFWLFALLALPSIFFLEYGTFGVLFAMMGYLARNRANIPTLSSKDIRIFILLTTLAYALGMWHEFHFETVNAGLMTVLLLCQSFLLFSFKPADLPVKNPIARLLKYPLFLTGRRTLEIYVVHLLIFMYVKAYGVF